MASPIEDFINKTALKDQKILADIFRELTTKYPDETRRQRAVRGAIIQYERQYHAEMRKHEREMRRFRETRDNKFASDDVHQMRIAFRFPESLVTRINLVLRPPLFSDKEPMFLSDESMQLYNEDTWIRDNFPRYVAPEVY